MAWRRSFIAAASTAVLAGIFVSSALAEDVTLTIGKLLELTGPLSENAPSQDKAINIAVDYANQAAQAGGGPIKATALSADGPGDPQAARASMRLLPIKDEGTIFRTVPPHSLQARPLAAAVESKLGGASRKLLSLP